MAQNNELNMNAPTNYVDNNYYRLEIKTKQTGTGTATDPVSQPIRLVVDYNDLLNQPNLDNYVVGPASATDNALVRYDGATGKKIQNSGIIIDDNNNLTTNGIVKIQNGTASGAFVLGADVNAKTLTANTRKLGRMGVPSYDSTTKTVAGISFDSQPTVNFADFGGHPNNTSSIAPDVIRFIVANSHDNTVNGARILALQISKQDGLVDMAGGGTSVAAAKFFIPVQATSSITGNEGFIHGGLTAATGKTKNDYILLAGGSTKPISDFALATEIPDMDPYMPKSGGQFTGPISFKNETALPSKTLQYIVGIDAFASGGQAGWQSKSDFLSGYVAGSGLTADTILLGNGDSKIKTSSKKIVTSISGSANVPTDAAVKSFVEGKGYITSDTQVTNTLNTTTKYYVTGTTSTTTNTGTQIFDTGVYVSATSGALHANTVNINEQATMKYDTTNQCIRFVIV